MINSHCNQDTAAQQNKSSLQTLSRTLRMSQGQFSLILVRCNYSAMREETVRQLREDSGIEIREIVLPTSVKTLYTTIETELTDSQPPALMVFGLESVSAIDRVLTSTNYVREEFRNNFPFPVVLWVTDKILKKLIRLVTDIETWTTTVEFVLGPDELVDFLGKSADRIFSDILENGNWRLSNSAIIGANSLTELESASQDLQTCNIRLEPAIEASLQFIRGRHEYACHRIPAAVELYQKSLTFWKYQVPFIGAKTEFSDLLFTVHPAPVLEGIMLFHIGLCYRFQAEHHRNGNRPYWTEAKNYFQQCIDVLEGARQSDAVGIFINQLGEVLQHLEDWDALWNLAIKARRLHQNMENSAVNLAQDYGFLARVALEQKNWQGAKEWALVALEVLNSNLEATGQGTPVKSQHQGLYLLILAEAQSQLGEIEEAIAHLELARSETEACYNPQLYLRVLEMLRSLYFQRGEYLEAFQIKQDYRAVEHTYRFRAFIGAGKLQPHREAINPAAETVATSATIADEITASGREEDLNRLIYRMNNTPDKLTVIYGQSGVGKSSIVTGGLVPALKEKKIEMRTVLPVVLQVYNNWPRELTRQLSAGKAEIFDREISEAVPGAEEVDFPVEAGAVKGNLVSGFNGGSAGKNEDKIEQSQPVELILEQQAIEYEKIIKELQTNSEHLVTVLIFDQFEEFFFVWKEPAARQIFFDFLRKCLKIKYLKVVLSLREDYLHYLLEFSRPKNQTQFINNDILADILSKDILFYLGNFSLGDARSVIRTLTERSQFYLEPELIEELVKDLAGELGEVRPIELQLVGAQLQQEDIRTLTHYQELGNNPQQKLVERFLEEVIKDCGPENEVAARRVLYLLTDEDEIRPLKTRAELASNLATFAEAEKLDLVLELLVKSGLVFRWTELPAELYQLVHDYLVSFIRQQQESDKKAEFDELRKQNQINRDEIDQIRKDRERDALLSESRDKQRQARDKQHEAEAQLYQARRWQLRAAVLGVLVLGGVSAMAFEQAKLAESARQEAEKSRTDALNSASQALVLSNEKNQLGVLGNSIKIGRDSLKSTALPADTKNQIAERLRQAVSGVQERNRFEQHSKFVLDVSVSPDGNSVASASADKTVKLWSKEGKLLKTFNHGDSVTSVSLSPDGKTIATGCADRKIRIWQADNDKSPIATLEGHQDIVTSVSFSPDGKTLASSSHDKTVKIWNITSKKLLQTLKGHKDWVLGVKFSPDGKTIASASADKTVKLWNREGKTQKFQINPKTLNKHSDIVYSVSFSPNNQEIVTASADTTVKIWNRKGEEIRTLKGHNDEVVSASFSRDGEKIVTGSADDTVKVWNRSGTLLSTFRGHQDDVRAVTFSRDGTIASASKDKMVKIWNPDRTPLNKILSGHGDWVYKVSFSADGKTIASASGDKTVRLWRAEGSLFKTLAGHKDSVTWVSISPDDKTVASASDDKTVKVWSLDGKLLDTLNHSGIVRSVSFSPDGKTIAAASADRNLYLWRWNGSKATLLAKLDHSNPVISVSFSPDGKTIAVATATDDKSTANKNAFESAGANKVYLWQFNGSEAKILKTLAHPDSVKDVSFSPDGKTIATACADKKVYLWRFDGKGATIAEKLDHSDTVESVSFSPDGKLIAAASGGNTVKLWNFDGQKAILSKTLESSDRVLSVSFSSDSKTLAFASRDRTVILWPLENLELNNIIARSCEWVENYLQNDPNVAEGDRMLCLGFGKQALNKGKR
ncbi:MULTISPECIES: WD40 domain-containing protein [unclassified Microcoleus]|uniref:WD40 domain-containing protein n=1 Tax=unclassified Microcoleus TaxID=2642155 RepID=UPI002FD08700